MDESNKIVRSYGREPGALRPVHIELNPNKYAEGSCIISYGATKVLCTASLEDRVPKWLQESGQGWVSAEYSMLPRSTHQRIRRDKGTNSGRSLEISRLIARSLRAAVDLSKMPEKSIMIDCDVLQADGGTRTASITGGFIALKLATEFLLKKGDLKESPIITNISAVSLGCLSNHILVDLDYDEDSQCECDVNFVMNSQGEFIEIQGTAETKSFSKNTFVEMMGLAEAACNDLQKKQDQCN